MKTRFLEPPPRQDGFRMPAEFEPHEKCWMLWPKRSDNWRLCALPAQKAFAAVAKAISTFEPVTIGVWPDQIESARQILDAVKESGVHDKTPAEIKIIEMASDDAWMRDVGPTFVKNDQGQIRGVDWRFNAWGGMNGGLYVPWDKDEKIAQQVLIHENKERYRAPLILEGGSIHTDGQGTLLTTEQCLLHPNRNPDMSRRQIETCLKDYLNIETIIWLDKGVYMDETDGHIDNLCCFIRPAEVLLTWTDDPSDPQYSISCDAFERLSKATDAKGRKLDIHKIHQPGPLFMTEEESGSILQLPGTVSRKKGTRLPGSYVNFYMPDNGIILPLFDDPWDIPALEQLSSLFPDRTVVGVQAREILLGGGNIHCITQQQPRA